MIKQFIKRLFCKHKWEDWSNMPYGKSFVCKKCGKEIWIYPR